MTSNRPLMTDTVIIVLESLAEPSDAAVEAAAFGMFKDEKQRLGIPLSQWEWEQTALTWRNNARAALRAARLAELGKTIDG